MNKKKYIMPAVHTRIVFADDLLLTISGESDLKLFCDGIQSYET